MSTDAYSFVQFPSPGASAAAAISDVLQRDGICVLREMFSPGETEQLKSEIMAAVARKEPWLHPHEARHGFFCSYSPLVVRRNGFDRQTASLYAAFSHPLFASIARLGLGAGWYIERIILDRQSAHPEPVTDWHADQFRARGRCLKFMIYLGDTDATNGAFSSVPGSHHLIRALVGEHMGDNRELHTIDQIRDHARKARDPLAPELLGAMEQHIQSAGLSDDYYSVCAPAGSCIVFDANGVHRGGVVRQGERFLARSHCRSVSLGQTMASRSETLTMLQRIWLRATAPAGLPRLF